MIVKLLTEHHLEFLSLNGDCRGSSESTVRSQNTTLLGITGAGSYYYIDCRYVFAYLSLVAFCTRAYAK